MSGLAKFARRHLGAAAIVGLSTVAAEVLYRLTSSTRLSMVFLAGVLVTAYLLGSGPAYFAAALAFLIYNFYLVDPRFSISFSTAEDLITLTVFLAVAMLTGSLTGRVRDEAARAEARARLTSILFDASREFSASSDEDEICRRLAQSLAAAAGGEAVIWRGGQTFASTEGPVDPRLAALIEQTAQGRELRTTKADGRWNIRPFADEQGPPAAAAWRPARDARLDAESAALLDIVVDSGAAALARARLAAGKADAETRARTEDLRNALLSSISHDLRTPLAAIVGSASSLREFDKLLDEAARQDLAATIQEEAERLDLMVANLLNMTRLQAGALAIQRAPFSVPDVVRRTVQRRTRAARRTVVLSAEPGMGEALGDPTLFEQALGNVVENALRYTPAEAALLVTSRAEGGEIVVEVTDAGPGLPEDELERIFDRFFRSPSASQKPGTGLGLSIVKGLMEGMEGSVTARNRADGVSGLAVELRLPVAA